METQMKKRTKVSVNSEDWLPVDLMMEILKRSPVKTLIRFICVSKFWASIIRSRDFMKLFINESLKRPKSLVFVYRTPSMSLLPSVHLKNTHESSSSSPATYFVSFPTRQRVAVAPSVHGLICYGPPSSLVIYNPFTRRSITLPKIKAWKRAANQYIGYDPIGGDYKVLCIMREISKQRNRRCLAEEIQVLTLGITGSSWRKIQGIIPPHSPVSGELCINGALYYRAFVGTKLNESAIMSFDVRSEKLDVIKGPCTFRSFSKLTKYEGKLAVVFFEKKAKGIIGLWVLEDASKEEWSKKIFVLPNLAASIRKPRFRWFHWLRSTDADTGEILFTPFVLHPALSIVVCYDLKNKSMRTIAIQGTTEKYPDSIRSVSTAQENLMFL